MTDRSAARRRGTPRRDVPSRRDVPPWKKSSRRDGGARVELPRPLLCLLASVGTLLVAFWVRSCALQPTNAGDDTGAVGASQDLAPAATGSYATDVKTKLLDEGRTTASGAGRLSFAAVGDNLANENILELADAWSGKSGDGTYDFSPLYRDVTPMIQESYDVSFINQETTLGSTKRFAYAGYPSYNTPDSMAQAVGDAGFRVVNTNTNHTYDTWVDSILHSQDVWNSDPRLLAIGSYASEEDRSCIRVVECNGIRLAFLSYCYGQNGYEQSDLPNDYYAVPYSAETLRKEVAQAKTVSDAVVVYMHWGTEYVNVPSDEQLAAAQACADAGVDLVIGSHAHVIQPMSWVDSADGSGRTLVAYGLGDFASGYHNNPDCVLSGMMSCDFVRGEDGSVSIGNAAWHPLIEHWAGSDDRVCLLRDYTDELARQNELLSGLGDPLAWAREKTKSVMGEEFPLDM